MGPAATVAHGSAYRAYLFEVNSNARGNRYVVTMRSRAFCPRLSARASIMEPTLYAIAPWGVMEDRDGRARERGRSGRDRGAGGAFAPEAASDVAESPAGADAVQLAAVGVGTADAADAAEATPAAAAGAAAPTTETAEPEQRQTPTRAQAALSPRSSRARLGRARSPYSYGTRRARPRAHRRAGAAGAAGSGTRPAAPRDTTCRGGSRRRQRRGLLLLGGRRGPSAP